MSHAHILGDAMGVIKKDALQQLNCTALLNTTRVMSDAASVVVGVLRGVAREFSAYRTNAKDVKPDVAFEVKGMDRSLPSALRISRSSRVRVPDISDNNCTDRATRGGGAAGVGGGGRRQEGRGRASRSCSFERRREVRAGWLRAEAPASGDG